MYTDLENSPPQYRAFCGILSDLDLAHPEAPVVIKPETLAILNTFSAADWDDFVRMAKAEGVAPLMHYAFSRSNYSLPATTRLQLQMIYYETAAFNQMILTEMGRVVQALNEANIPVIVLKGASLANTIYPDPASRPMSDLDVITPAPFVGKAVKLLRLMKFELLKITNHAVFENDGLSDIRIELHWTLAGERSLSNKEVADFINDVAAQPDTSFSQLSFTLLYLCAHLMLQHSKMRLIWLFDIFAFLRKYQAELDWNDTITVAQRLGWVTALDASIQVVVSKFNLQLSDDMQAALGESKKLTPKYQNESTQLLMTRAFLALSFFNRILMMWFFLFPAPRYLRGRYRIHKRWHTLFYYPYRWWKMMTGDI